MVEAVKFGPPVGCPMTTSTDSFILNKRSYAAPSSGWLNVNYAANHISSAWTSDRYPKKWVIHSSSETVDFATLNDEDKSMWESCRQALSAFDFSVEEKDKILGKAFGHIHTPYWGEERKKEIPKIETINSVLGYLRSLGLSDEDLFKLLKKFPEVLACSLENELRLNTQILEKQWGIKGKSLRSLLLRNPKVLGYNVDCKGDCIAQCTRCWARF